MRNRVEEEVAIPLRWNIDMTRVSFNGRKVPSQELEGEKAHRNSPP